MPQSNINIIINQLVKALDISDPSNPTKVGGYDTGYAWDVYISGSYAYIADYYNGLVVIDISDPYNPKKVGGYDTAGIAYGVYISGSYAYIADDWNGLVIVKISVTAPNVPPTASFTYTPSSPTTEDTVTFDASGSYDPDGSIINYNWNFGDGNTATGITTTHLYASAGSYDVTLTVTNDDGARNSTSKVITIQSVSDTTPPSSITNLQPTIGQTWINWTWSDPIDSDFSKVLVYLDGSFRANVSKRIQYYNATNLEPDTLHTIATRTVDTSENLNQTWINNTARTAPTPTPNQSPIANFTYSPESPVVNQTITFDASYSSDPDGNITSYEWNFGDNTSGNGVIVTHSYLKKGNYTVTLTVTDDKGATNSITDLLEEWTLEMLLMLPIW